MKSASRNPQLNIPADSDNFFHGETVHLQFGKSLTSMSRDKNYHLWNFGSWEDKPTVDDLIKMLVYLKSEADEKWGVKPMRGMINDKCPFVNEFKNSGKLVTELKEAIESVQGEGTFRVYDEPITLEIPITKDGESAGLFVATGVLGHTLPFDFIEE